MIIPKPVLITFAVGALFFALWDLYDEYKRRKFNV